MRPTAYAVAAMVGSAACWGGATVASKAVLTHLPPFSLLALQLTGSVAVLWIATALTRASRQGLTVRLSSSGLLEPGMAYAVGVPGLALTGAASASIISATEPMVIALIAALVLRRPISALSAVGLLGGFLGVVLLTAAHGGGSRLLGDALIFLGVLFAALYVLVSARMVTRVDPLPLAAGQQSMGLILALAILGLARWTGFEPSPGPQSPQVIASALATGVVQYALAFWLYLTGLRTLPMTTAAQFLTLTPVFGTLGAAVFLAERLVAWQVIGAGITILSIWAVLRGDRPSGPPEPR
jgi:drug/metabolite transporter (DMT)-like permease